MLVSVPGSEAVVVAALDTVPAASEAEYGLVTVKLLETGGDAAVFDGPLVEPPDDADVLRRVSTAEEVGTVDATLCELDVGLSFAILPVGIRPVDDALGEVVRLPETGDVAVTPVPCGFDKELELVGLTDGVVYVLV